MRRQHQFKRVRLAILTLLVPMIAMSQIPEDEVSPFVPLSSMVAVTYNRGSIATLVKENVQLYAQDELPENVQFPLPARITDTVRVLDGLKHNVVVKWLDPLTKDRSTVAPRFGANADFIAFFGDGWDADWENGAVGSGPMTNGSSSAGWIWTNHEYISNAYPTATSGPAGQHLTFAKWLQGVGVLTEEADSDTWAQADVDAYIRWHKTQVGGSWFRVQRNMFGEWYVDTEADAKRYDASSNTLSSVVGYEVRRNARTDDGSELPANVVPGIMGDCSGGQTPWGTILTAEENVQAYYGDLETAWSSSNRFKSGEGFDPGSAITFNTEPLNTDGQVFGRSTNPNDRKDRDNYGFLAEIDPGVDPSTWYQSVNNGGDGSGHRKLGVMGRVRWENATVAMGSDFSLEDGKPVVIYGGNDRRSGRIYKFVSSEPFTTGMTKGQVRALLDNGKLYVAHFAGLDHKTGYTLYDSSNPDGGGITPVEAAPGNGVWIEMSINNTTDVAPNAAALGAGTTVGQALRDVNWNGIGGFTTDNDVRAALFTAANKLGVAELNRPEDLEYNPIDLSGTPRIYAAFTNHTRPAANNQQGVLDDSTPRRADSDGSIFSMQEENPTNPGSSKTFTYWMVWKGGVPSGLSDPATFVAGDPDNLAIDKDGGVWFGTDGHAGSSGDTRSDAIYYLDMDPAHKEGATGVVNATFGYAFRVIASPGDAEATGPWFTPDNGTLFFNVQHPGEDYVSTPSTWPQERQFTPRERSSFLKRAPDAAPSIETKEGDELEQ